MTPTPSLPTTQAQAGSAGRLRAYLVEDNATIRTNLSAALLDLVDVAVIGYAETEESAITWLRAPKHDWDLAIVDFFLREGTGLGVLGACRERAPHQKMVVLSNFATIDMRTRCKNLGADSVFDKSTDLDALMAFCEELGPAPTR